MKPTIVSGLVLQGDSLSDRGTMAQRPIMDRLSGLSAKSPEGRFTNGFTWSDDICAAHANEFSIKQLERARAASHQNETQNETLEALDLPPDHQQHRRPALDDTDIADAVIDGEEEVTNVVRHSYTLDNNLRIDYEGVPFARSYAEGGLTAHNWGWEFISSVSLFFSRLVLSTLSKKRKELLADDRANEITPEQKAETLIIEWSGANDLITVNKHPTFVEVDKAVQARIENVRELMKSGYKHFVLFNLPDLGLTPRYKNTEGEANARACSQYFNTQLEEACKALAVEYNADNNPHFSIEVFDVSTIFSRIYHDPTAYGFEPEKRSKAYTSSDEFIRTKDHTSPAPGFMFWDDVHPTARMHYNLANELYKKLSTEYNIVQPRVGARDKIRLDLNESALVGEFRRDYRKKLSEDKSHYFGFFSRSNMAYRSVDNLETILEHALYNGGHRSLKVIQELGWLDDRKNLIPDCPALERALEVVKARHEGQVPPLSPTR